MIRLPSAAAPLAALVALALGGCSTHRHTAGGFFDYLTPYRIDIVQGNVVTREGLELVRPGMTRTQVRDALGTPLLTDIFHADRWDYLFTIRRQGTEPQRRSVVLRFEGDVLDSIEAPPDLPSELEFVASITRERRAVEPRVLELTEEQRQALPVPPRRDAPAAEPAGPVREYPPLEPL
jgi:outer membrane protein assembly factor BamE